MEGACAACGKDCAECVAAMGVPGDECHCGAEVEEKCEECGNAMSGCTCAA
ncbi:MAG: hypothetical protein AAB663_02160 [Patescibacteria group bacterium]